MEYKETQIARILNPTSIDLGEYVINPYMGCEYACLYCYVRSNKVVSRKKQAWGTYVEARLNAPKLLEKEILIKKPKSVLMGSTCECFQPLEEKYKITQGILEVLNSYGVYYTILTRSPFITRYTPLLKNAFCKKIYFTINNIPQELKCLLEEKSPPFKERISAINALLGEGVNVVPYFSPILPWISDLTNVFLEFPGAESVDFETLNFRLFNIDKIVNAIGDYDENLKYNYVRLMQDGEFYDGFWKKIENEIIKQAKQAQKRYNIHIHKFGGYFDNRYTDDYKK